MLWLLPLGPDLSQLDQSSTQPSAPDYARKAQRKQAFSAPVSRIAAQNFYAAVCAVELQLF